MWFMYLRKGRMPPTVKISTLKRKTESSVETERRGSEKERRGGVWREKGWGRRGIPPTESLVERFWGLGRSLETVVAPSQASHRAALGHPVTNRQTHQMAWLGHTDRDLFIFHPLVMVGGLFSTSCLLDL